MVSNMSCFLFRVAILCILLCACSPSHQDSGNGKNPISDNPNHNAEFEVSIHAKDCMSSNPWTTNWQEELGNSIRFGDAACAKKAIERGAQVNQSIREFGSNEEVLPIFMALRPSSLFFAKDKPKEFAVLKVLVEAGVRLNVKDDAGDSPLIHALKKSDLFSKYPLVPGYLIFSGKADLNERDRKGNTPLLLAIRQDLHTLSKQMILKGSNVNLKSLQGESPLQLALSRHQEEIASLLVDHKADLSVRDAQENTVLHWAIEFKQIEFIRKIVPLMGEAINAQNTDLETGLFKAIELSLIDIVQLLIEHKANVDLSSKKESPVHIALKLGQKEILALLLPRITNINAKNSNGQPLIFSAALERNWLVFQNLMDRGADLTYRDPNGQTLLHKVSLMGAPEWIGPLVDRGLKVNDLDQNQKTPLVFAVEANSLETVEALLTRQANSDLIVEGETLLLYALSRNRMSTIIDRLIQTTTLINAQNSQGETALHLLIKQKLILQAQQWLEKNPQLDIQDTHLNTPLSLAVSEDQLEIARALLQKGATPHKVLEGGQTLMHLTTSTSLADLLIQYQVPLDEKQTDGETPLSLAVRRGQLSMVRYFVGKKANLHWTHTKKRTLLHRAANEGLSAIVLFLIESGINIQARDDDGRVALFTVSNPEVIEILIRSGLSADSTDSSGVSVLSFFLEFFQQQPNGLHLRRIQTLLKGGANPNVKMRDGTLLLHSVVEFKIKSHPEYPQKVENFNASALLNILLQVDGLDLEAKDSNDETALHKVDTAEEAKILITKGAFIKPLTKDRSLTPLQLKLDDFTKNKASQSKLNDDIAINKKLLKDAEDKGDSLKVRRLNELIQSIQEKVTQLELEAIELQLLLGVLEAHGG